ncbi:MAG: S8 family serine peptidase, partial [Candidatus Hermodarchaeota archaeon]
MLRFIEPYPYETRKTSSSNLKMIAVIVIFMLVISAGLIMLLPLGDLFRPTSGSVKVAVIDSGIDMDYSLQGRVANQTSFVLSEYGYLVEDTTVTDSAPDGGIHGTVVAKEIASLSSNAIILNAKILGSSGTATSRALIAAIQWAVEMNCSVINLSLGSLPSYEDPLEEVIAWAFDRGVILVAAAGNEGEDGIAGNQINSPAVFEKCLAVAGLTEFGNPASFTSPGPTASRYMKPDLAAPGYFDVGTYRYSGTSFAAPRVSAAAVDLIAFCAENGIAYTA